MRQLRFRIVLFLSLFATSIQAQDFAFSSLPDGKEVTLPRQTVTLVGATERVRLSPTDMPQSIKISSVHPLGAPGKNMTITIKDANAKRPRRFELKPGGQFLYAFKNLAEIALLIDAPRGVNAESAARNYGLRIESDKPLSVAR